MVCVPTPKTVRRSDDLYVIPKSLFDRPTSMLARFRRELLMNRMKLWPGSTVLQSPIQLTMKQLNTTVAPVSLLTPSQSVSKFSTPNSLCPDWSLSEDFTILSVLMYMQDVPFNLCSVFPGVEVNWDLIADVVNSLNGNQRSPDYCRFHYESIISSKAEPPKAIEAPNPPSKEKTSGTAAKPKTKKVKNQPVPVPSHPVKPPSGINSHLENSNASNKASLSLASASVPLNRLANITQAFYKDNNEQFTTNIRNQFKTMARIEAKRGKPVYLSHFKNQPVKSFNHAEFLKNKFDIDYKNVLSIEDLSKARADKIDERIKQLQNRQDAARNPNKQAQQQQPPQQQVIQGDKQPAQQWKAAPRNLQQPVQIKTSTVTSKEAVDAVKARNSQTFFQTQLQQAIANGIVINEAKGSDGKVATAPTSSTFPGTVHRVSLSEAQSLGLITSLHTSNASQGKSPAVQPTGQFGPNTQHVLPKVIPSNIRSRSPPENVNLIDLVKSGKIRSNCAFFKQPVLPTNAPSSISIQVPVARQVSMQAVQAQNMQASESQPARYQLTTISGPSTRTYQQPYFQASGVKQVFTPGSGVNVAISNSQPASGIVQQFIPDSSGLTKLTVSSTSTPILARNVQTSQLIKQQQHMQTMGQSSQVYVQSSGQSQLIDAHSQQNVAIPVSFVKSLPGSSASGSSGVGTISTIQIQPGSSTLSTPGRIIVPSTPGPSVASIPFSALSNQQLRQQYQVMQKRSGVGPGQLHLVQNKQLVQSTDPPSSGQISTMVQVPNVQGKAVSTFHLVPIIHQGGDDNRLSTCSLPGSSSVQVTKLGAPSSSSAPMSATVVAGKVSFFDKSLGKRVYGTITKSNDPVAKPVVSYITVPMPSSSVPRTGAPTRPSTVTVTIDQHQTNSKVPKKSG